MVPSPNGATIRYRARGKAGVCETTRGVNPYSEYISLNATNPVAVQEALEVNINYTTLTSFAVSQRLAETVIWFGGEVASLALNYTDARNSQAAGDEPYIVDGIKYGEVRRHGHFSFLRMYESGHEMPYCQPTAARNDFRRVLGNLILNDGDEPAAKDYETNGRLNATHTELFMPLPNSMTTNAY